MNEKKQSLVGLTLGANPKKHLGPYLGALLSQVNEVRRLNKL
jgi:hypothetical protein